MPLFAQSMAQKFTPKEIKFSDIYKFGAKAKNLSGSVVTGAFETLKQNGFDESEINHIIRDDNHIPVLKMKKVVEILNRNNIYGFTQDPKILVQNYLTRERVKAQSIARIRKEHMLEQRQGTEEETSYGVTSLNNMQRAKSSLSDKPASTLSNKPVSSLTGSSKTVNSLNNVNTKTSLNEGSSSPDKVNLGF